MLFRGVFGLILLGLWLFCLIDVITTRPDQCRNLPKWAWVLVVVFLAEIGAIVWLVAGRGWQPREMAAVGAKRRAAPTASAPDDDEEYLAMLRERVDEQRRRARDERRRDDDAGSGSAE